MKPRDLLAAAAAGLLASAVTLVGAGDRLEGWSIDALFWLRYQAYGALHTAATSPSAVIAIDEETFRTPPFADLPQPLWTPQLGKVLSAVLEADAAVVGFDVILSTSVEPFLRGYDRDYMIALQQGGRAGRVVLGKVQHSQLPIAPYRGHSFAVGNAPNIRATNLVGDDDEVIRRAPLTFRVDDRQAGSRTETAFALELAARAAHAPIDWSSGPVTLGGWLIPQRDDAMLINFDGGGADIPTYPLSDIYACADAGKFDYLREHFAGKVVLIGLIADVEDRKPTSRHLINGSDGAGRQPRCATEPLAALQGPPIVRDLVPGVLVHATAINNLLRRDVLRDLSPTTDVAIIGGAGVAAATVSVLAPLGVAAAALAVGVALYGALATAAMHAGLVLPLLAPPIVVALAFALVLAYRITVADKDKRLFRQMFSRLLSSELVDHMIKAERLPELGGERREMSFLFTDVAGFTSMAERMDPSVLAPILNRYLDGACEVIKRNGGMVNEFIGDAILAFFGAPADQPDHAARIVACARELDSFAEAFRQAQQDAEIPFGKTRIGVHTGTVFVGHVGSEAVRMKYSALGDVVNTASRLEGLNKFFGTRVIVSGDTLAHCDESRVRPLGRFVLKGRHEPIDVYEMVEEPRSASAAITRYREAYRMLEAGDPRAEAAFAALAAELPDDGCVALHLERLRAGARDNLVVMEEK